MELKNPGPIEFEAVIQREQEVESSSAWVDFPFDLKETYGKGNLVPVIVTFDKEVKYEGSLAKMGGDACILLRKDIREKLGKSPGDKVYVKVELDTRERKIDLAVDVKSALLKSDLLAYFENLAYTHQREYNRWIEEAKREETRKSRIEKMQQMLKDGIKTPD